MATVLAENATSLASYTYPGTVHLNQDTTTHAIQLQTATGSLAAVDLIVKSQASQTGALFQAQDSNSNVLASIDPVTGMWKETATPTQQLSTINGNNLFPGSAPASVDKAAINASVPPLVIASNTVGGSDYTPAPRYVAQMFNSGNFTSMTALMLSLRVASSVLANVALPISIYLDNGSQTGPTGASIGGFVGIAVGMSQGVSNIPVYFSDGFTTQIALTANTNYWLVMDTNNLGSGMLTLDSRTDTGSGVVTSPDNTTWTTAGTLTLNYAVYATTMFGAASSSFGSHALLGNSVAGIGVSGYSVNGVAGNFTSVNWRGISVASTYSDGVVGQSTWGGALRGIGVHSRGLVVSGGGTSVQAGVNNQVGFFSRVGSTQAFTQSGALIQGNDAMVVSAGGANISPLLTLQQANTDRFVVDHLGTITTGSVAPLWGAAASRIGLSTWMTVAPTSASLSTVGGALTNGAVYRYVITVLGYNGAESQPSPDLVVTIPAGGTGTSGSVTINWTAQNTYQGYKLYRTPANGVKGTWTDLVATIPAGTTTFADTGTATTGTAPLVTNVGMVAGWDGSQANGFLLPYTIASVARATGLMIYSLNTVSTLWGPIDNASTGHFVGSGSGTYLGINTGSAFIGDLARYEVFGSDRYRLTASGLITQTIADAVTNTQTLARTIVHTTSGTPTTNFGTSYKFQAHSSNNTVRDQVALVSYWTTATDGAQTSNLQIQTVLAGAALTGVYTFGGGGPLTIVPAIGQKAAVLNGNSIGTVNLLEMGVSGTLRSGANARGDLLMGNAGTGGIIGEMAAPAGFTAGASSGTGGNLTNGSTYFWVAVFVDTLGNETIPSAEVTATIPAGAGTAGSQVLTWTASTGYAVTRIYRTAAGGAAGSENVLAGTVAAGISTFTDTAVGSAQSPANPTGSAAVRQPGRMGMYNHNALYNIFASEYTAASTVRGVVSLGSGSFDGATTGFFAGSGAGTMLAMNTIGTRDFARYQLLGSDRYQITSTGVITSWFSDATTATQPVIRTFNHRTSGTPAANFGSTLKFGLDSSNNTLRDAASIVPSWTVATDGSQASQLAFQTVTAGGALTTAATLIPAGWSVPTAVVSDAATNTQATALNIYHKTSGSAAASFGVATAFLADSDTTAQRTQGQINTQWATVTDASRKARMTLFVNDTAIREGLRIEASGTAAMIGVLGAAAIARTTATAAASDAASTQTLANALRTLMINFGLWS